MKRGQGALMQPGEETQRVRTERGGQEHELWCLVVNIVSDPPLLAM